MKTLFISLLILAGLTVSAQQTQVINDPNAQVRSLNGSFNAISVATGVELFLTQGDEPALAVSSADDKYLARFKTEIVDGELRIYFDNDGMNNLSGRGRKLKAYLSVKSFDRLKASSGAVVRAQTTLALGNLQMKFSSGALFTGTIQASTIDIDQSSGSQVELSGATSGLAVEVSSGAVFKGYEITTDKGRARASSGGQVRLTVNKEIEAHASSGGEITYKGTPVLRDVNVSSGGSVKRA